MAETPRGPKDVWKQGASYEPYIGRWSRLVAREFLPWLDVAGGRRWLDVGCGTGALSQTIIDVAAPAAVTGVDHSEGFVAFAREHVRDARVRFEVGDAQDLAVETGTYDVAVSGLMLNLVPRPDRAAEEMTRAVRPGGVVAVYVWDYAGRMDLLRQFWNAATALDPATLDEGPRFSICHPDRLAEVFGAASLRDIQVRPLDIQMHFRDFDDFWLPFLGGQGPAPAYTMSLSEERRAALRERIRAGLPFAADGSIPLGARAWAVRGRK